MVKRTTWCSGQCGADKWCTLVESTIATRHEHVLICVSVKKINNNKLVIKKYTSLGDPEAHTWCSSPPLN